jgi:hypothetical protein
MLVERKNVRDKLRPADNASQDARPPTADSAAKMHQPLASASFGEQFEQASVGHVLQSTR